MLMSENAMSPAVVFDNVSFAFDEHVVLRDYGKKCQCRGGFLAPDAGATGSEGRIPSRLTPSLQPTAATPRAIAIDTCVGFAGCVLNNSAAAGM